jgi:hypothetical protein
MRDRRWLAAMESILRAKAGKIMLEKVAAIA